MTTDVLYLNGRTIDYKDIKEGNFSFSTEFEQSTLTFCRQWLNGQQAFSLQTSGSTGQPKTIEVSREQMESSAAGTIPFFNLRPGDTALVCLSTAYIAGKMMLVRALEGNMKIVAVDPGGNPLEKITDTIDFMAVVPLQLKNIMEDESTLAKLKTIAHTIVGGAPVTYALQQAVRLTKANVYATFGMTETLTHIALKQLSPDPEDCYTVIKNVTIGQDARGCLTVQGPVTNNELLITTDLIDQVSERKFRWLGRIDHIINSGGIKIPIEVLEEKIAQVMFELRLDSRFFVYSQPDQQLGERVMLLIESSEPFTNELQVALTLSLHKYELPKSIDYVGKFVETPTGKVDRKSSLQEIDI